MAEWSEDHVAAIGLFNSILESYVRWVANWRPGGAHRWKGETIGQQDIANLMNLMSLIVVMLCCLIHLIICNSCLSRVGCTLLRNELNRLKLESKDSLLVRVWNSIELFPLKPYILGVGLWPCWWLSLAELYLLRLCLDVVLQVCLSLPISESRSWGRHL
jgi:hypothetical protein